MKKLFFFLMALLLPLFALDISADDENAKMKIPLKLETSKHFTRSLIEEPLTCHYYDMMKSIVTTVTSDQGNVSLTVTNLSTGEIWYDVFDSGTELQVYLPISGTSGLYEIVYTTKSGDVYEGEFVLN